LHSIQFWERKYDILLYINEGMRTFISIDVVEREEIKEIMDELKKTGAKLKMVEPENIHLTIKFLGEVDENLIEKVKEAMKEAIDGIKSFKAELKGVGVFPSMNYIRIIWIGFNDNGVSKKIAERIDDALKKYGFSKEKSYVPHVTIARVKGGGKKENLREVIEKNKEKSFGLIECSSIRLKKSVLRKEGPLYETIFEIKI